MKRFLLSFAFATLLIPPCNLHADGQIDQQIMKEIQRILGQAATQGSLKGYKLELEVANGDVTLKGYVSTPEQQTLVVNAARRVSGVKLVANNIIVRQTRSAPDTAAASFSLTDSTAGDESIQSNDSHVSEADSLALNSPANYSISQSASDPNQFDEEIAELIIQRVLDQQADGILRGYKIYMQVNNGTVSLKGYVSNDHQKAVVLKIASRTAGVKQVVNGLAIKGALSNDY